MPATLTALGLDRLPREERLALVQALWDSIAAEGQPLLSDDQRTELGRRADDDDDDDADPGDVIPWDQVKAKAQVI